jgi:1-acyl-sn-glycerol-3-phosphate acyltransferase
MIAVLALTAFALVSGPGFSTPVAAGSTPGQALRQRASMVGRGAGAVAPFPLEQFGPLRLRRGRLEEAVGMARMFPAYILSFGSAFFIFPLMVLSYPIVLLRDPVKRVLMDKWNLLWAKITTLPFFGVRVINPENLPAADDDKAYVYVSNHQSFMDILSMYFLGRSFKWVSKASIKKIPIIGWAMGLTGHVFLQREDRRSQMKTIRECIDKLKSGASMFFFPEGTRSKTGQLGEFKKGAFSIARKANVGMVPVTIMGTAELMPPGREFRVFHTPGVNLIVHPVITAEEVQTLPADELVSKAKGLINSGLPPSLQDQ